MYGLYSDLTSAGSGKAKTQDQGERRRDPRFQTREQAYVQTAFPDWSNRIPVTILDVSRAGLRLEAAEAIPAGSTIRVQLGGVFVLGEVRHCVLQEGRYRIGILIEDVFESNQR